MSGEMSPSDSRRSPTPKMDKDGDISTSRRWRNLMNRSKSPASRRGSGDGTPSSTASRRRPRRAHTLDNTVSTTPVVDDEKKLPRSSSTRGSLLQRFLASTARRRSQTNLSGEGSTVSRMTDDELDPALDGGPRVRRATMDAVDQSNDHPVHHASPGGFRNVLRRFSGDGPLNPRRRGSKDNSLDGDFPSSIMEEGDYQKMQARLQRKADDFYKSGQLVEAITQYVECLALAEDNFDSLATKTELMCVLVDLHLQLADEDRLDPADQRPQGAAATQDHSPEFHRKAAKRYVHRIKPALVKPSFWNASRRLLDLLVVSEAWELAILVADRLMAEQPASSPSNAGAGVQPALDPEQLATIHFQIASQKLDAHRQGEALQHLQATVRLLQQLPSEKRDPIMYVQVLQLLATEYSAQGQHDLALEAYQDQLQASPAEKHASLYCKMAHVYIVTHQLDLALQQLEAAASSLHLSEPSIRLQLLQTKGDVFCRLGRTEESFQVYQEALEEAVNPAEKAKLLYTLGRLCIRLQRTKAAISYFTKEMEITEEELGQQHMSVSRVLHELAKLYDEGLGEHKMALMKLHKALHIELAVLQEVHDAVTKCQKCNQVTHRMCTIHATRQREISNQIRETKKAQGRIHFKLGDFEKALKTSFDGTERTAQMMPRRSQSSGV
eukprot:Nitzschia sp. Nitz4//scaffold149_size55946//4060//6063//NITZ4_006586-RA/size55946-processed-gene-0.52-mRNA-1//-1//CDS//3329536785//7057//frame0